MIKLSIIIFISTISFTSCFSLTGEGVDRLLKEVPNIQHDKKAVLFLKEASLSEDSYQVSIKNIDSKFDTTETGNTFTVDADHGKTWLDSNSINLNWVSNDTLVINYNKSLRTFIQEKYVNGVTVIYQQK